VTAKAIVIGERVQNLRMSSAGRERIERKASPKIHHGHDRPAIGFQHLAAPVPKMPAAQADGSDERDACKQEVSSPPSHSEPIRPTTIFAVRRFRAKIPARVSSDSVPDERLHDSEPRLHHGGVKGKMDGPAAGT